MKGELKTIFKSAAILIASAFFASSQLLSESAFTLTTGEIVKGKVISKSAKGVTIKTAYAEFLVPYGLIENESVEKPKVDEIRTTADIPESDEMNMPLQEAEILAQRASLDELPEYPPMFDDTGSSNRTPLVETLLTWQQEYLDFMSNYIPEGWYFKVSGGYLLTQSTTSNETINLAFSAEREWETHLLKINGYYNYTLYTPAVGESYPTTDKYGLAYSYHWKFLDKDSGWFLNSSLSYKSDTIKAIETQMDQVVGLGYTHEFEEIGLKYSVDSGPSFRYLKLLGQEVRYIPAWSLQESVYWDITDLLRFEHTGSFSVPVNSSNDSSAYLMVGLVFAPKAVVSIALRYTGDYDNTTTALKFEQRFIVSLEIPLDGRKK